MTGLKLRISGNTTVTQPREELEAEYFEERRKEKERRTRIADKIKTLVVTNKEDLHVLSNEKFDFQCYTLDCKFVTNEKQTMSAT